MCGGGGRGVVVIAVNPNPTQESTVRSTGFTCLGIVYFLKKILLLAFQLILRFRHI